jgi:hypothetical protein
MIQIDATVDLSKWISTDQEIQNMLSPAGRKELNDAAATEVAELVRKHIAEYARTAHHTADTIAGGPAKRTGHLEWPNTDVQKGDVTSEEGAVEITSPGFRRVLGPLRIVPKTKSKLTVAVHEMSYGTTYGELIASGVKIFRPKGRDFLATTQKTADGAALMVLFLLKDEVTLKHQPDLLPKRNEFEDSAAEAVRTLVQAKFARRGAA